MNVWNSKKNPTNSH